MFKRFLSLIAVGLLAACAVPASGPVASAATCGLAAGTLLDEKALYGAETAYNVPANAYVTLDANGQLSPAIKAKARPMLINAFAALKLARTAYAAGNACGFQDAIKNAMSFASQAKAFLPSHN